MGCVATCQEEDIMTKRKWSYAAILLLLLPVIAAGQYRDSGFEVGILGGTAYDNSTGVEDVQPGLQGRFLLAGPLLPFAQWEIGGGYTELRARNVHSVLTPADPRRSSGFLPVHFWRRWNSLLPL
jgi:hypothetical protein